MDDSAKHTPSYQLDQEILDERGIDMTVEEVAGLSTCKYSERVQSLKLNEQDLAFLKGLRRRIKNRLASQNSRRRSVEHLRRLTRELRAVRACRNDALAERRALTDKRDMARERCDALRRYVVKILQERSDTTEIPSIDIKPAITIDKSPKLTDHKEKILENVIKEPKRPKIEKQTEKQDSKHENKLTNICANKETDIFECKIGKLVQQSVNHIYNEKKKVFAKTVFLTNEKLHSDIKSCVFEQTLKEEEVLNLSVKEGRRKSHGRKQLAPRRVAYYEDCYDGVLDLKIKKEAQ